MSVDLRTCVHGQKLRMRNGVEMRREFAGKQSAEPVRKALVTNEMIETACIEVYKTGSWGPGEWSDLCEEEPDEAEGSRELVRIALKAAGVEVENG